MEKINIAELLKDCPKGTKLYSPITGECTLDLVDNNGCDNVIRVNFYGGEDEVSYTSFYKYGNYFHNGECLLFPSKGKTTWEGFQKPFKDGDIITVANESNPFILHYESNGFYNAHCALLCGDLHVFTKQNNWVSTHREYRFATEEEKAKLFQAIKDNGYKWNQETKTLEKLVEPKFKVGDKIKNKLTNDYYSVIDIKCREYYIRSILTNKDYQIPFESDINYELVPNKFDITTLKPFDKVLVRDGAGFWRPSLFGKDMIVGYRYFTACGNYKECIPYENNEHLLGTRNDCDDFYKTWEK